MIRYHLSFVVAVSLSLQVMSGGAAEKAEAKKHFKAGLELMESKDFAGAAAEFERSSDLYPNKNNLINLATCYRKLDREVEALALFERVTRDYGTKLGKDQRQDIDKQIEEINSKLARLSITAAPDGATVKLNGKEVGRAPLSEPLILRRGSYVVEIFLEGYETDTRELALEGGDDRTETFELKEAKARLTVLSNESDAEILLNGDPAGKTPLKGPLVLEKGSYLVTVAKEGFEPKVKTVELGPGQEETVELGLAPVPAAAKIEEPGPPPEAPAEAAAPAAEPEKKKRSPLFAVGLAGTIVMAGVSAGMWGATLKKRNDYEDKNDALRNAWNDYLASQRDADRADAEKFNKAAVAATVIAGAFIALTVAGAVAKAADKRESPSAVTVSPGGLEVRF